MKTDIEFAAVATEDFRFDVAEHFALPNDVILRDKPARVAVAFDTQLSSSYTLSGGYNLQPGEQYSASNLLETHKDFGQSSFISVKILGHC